MALNDFLKSRIPTARTALTAQRATRRTSPATAASRTAGKHNPEKQAA